MVKTKTNLHQPIITLDSKHNEIMESFRDNEIYNIPKLKRIRYKYRKQLKQTSSVDIKLLCNDKIQSCTQTIKQMEQDKRSYFLDNSSLIFEYFEGKKNIELDTERLSASNTSATPLSTNSLLQNFFAAKPH